MARSQIAIELENKPITLRGVSKKLQDHLLNLVPLSASAASLRNSTSTINTSSRKLDAPVRDTTSNRLVVASGTGAYDPWYFLDDQALAHLPGVSIEESSLLWRGVPAAVQAGAYWVTTSNSLAPPPGLGAIPDQVYAENDIRLVAATLGSMPRSSWSWALIRYLTVASAAGLSANTLLTGSSSGATGYVIVTAGNLVHLIGGNGFAFTSGETVTSGAYSSTVSVASASFSTVVVRLRSDLDPDGTSVDPGGMRYVPQGTTITLSTLPQAVFAAAAEVRNSESWVNKSGKTAGLRVRVTDRPLLAGMDMRCSGSGEYDPVVYLPAIDGGQAFAGINGFYPGRQLRGLANSRWDPTGIADSSFFLRHTTTATPPALAGLALDAALSRVVIFDAWLLPRGTLGTLDPGECDAAYLLAMTCTANTTILNGTAVTQQTTAATGWMVNGNDAGATSTIAYILTKSPGAWNGTSSIAPTIGGTAKALSGFVSGWPAGGVLTLVVRLPTAYAGDPDTVFANAASFEMRVTPSF